MSKTKKIKNPKISTDWTPIALGLIFAAVGVALIFLREYITYIGIAVGALVCTGAIVLATLTFTGKRSGAAFIFKIIFSVCSLATGVVTIVCNAGATMIICLIFAGAIAIDGAIKFGNSIQARKYTVYGRTISLILALITTVAAMFVIRFISKEKIVEFSIALGACFVLDGFCNIIIPFLKSRINSAISKDLVNKTREVVAEEQRREDEQKRKEEEAENERMTAAETAEEIEVDESTEEEEFAEPTEDSEDMPEEAEPLEDAVNDGDNDQETEAVEIETETVEEAADEAAELTKEEVADSAEETAEEVAEPETPAETVEESDTDGEESEKKD
jgi:hypothetical protein